MTLLLLHVGGPPPASSDVHDGPVGVRLAHGHPLKTGLNFKQSISQPNLVRQVVLSLHCALASFPVPPLVDVPG